MDAVQKARADLKALAVKVENLSRERDSIDAQIRDARAGMAELEGALKVMQRYEAAPPSPSPKEPPPPLILQIPISNRDLMLKAVEEAPGRRVRDFVEYVEAKYKRAINIKTAGNILWALKQDELVAREGQNWRLNK